jgi:hypothetical protein
MRSALHATDTYILKHPFKNLTKRIKTMSKMTPMR